MGEQNQAQEAMRAELDNLKSQMSVLTEMVAKMQQIMEACLALTLQNEERAPTHPLGHLRFLGHTHRMLHRCIRGSHFLLMVFFLAMCHLKQPLPPEAVLEELLGHTPLQVVCGALLGITRWRWDADVAGMAKG